MCLFEFLLCSILKGLVNLVLLALDKDLMVNRLKRFVSFLYSFERIPWLEEVLLRLYFVRSLKRERLI